jgi:anaerobic selenocysteine-containing dehydrogenase
VELGIDEGDWCWIENQRGRCRQRAKLNPTLDERVVRAEHGWWFPETEGAEPNLFGVFDCNINNLTPQCENGPTGFGAPYKNQLCKIYKCTEENCKDLPSFLVTRKDGYSMAGAKRP